MRNYSARNYCTAAGFCISVQDGVDESNSTPFGYCHTLPRIPQPFDNVTCSSRIIIISYSTRLVCHPPPLQHVIHIYKTNQQTNTTDLNKYHCDAVLCLLLVSHELTIGRYYACVCPFSLMLFRAELSPFRNDRNTCSFARSFDTIMVS